MNAADLGVMLLDRTGSLLFANDRAESILQSENGLRRKGSSVAATKLDDGVRLQVAIDHVMAENRRGDGNAQPAQRAPTPAIRRQSDRSLVISVLPTRRRAEEPGDTAAIIYVLDPEIDPAKLIAPTCRLFHLSDVETQLATLLTSGLTLTAAAERMRINEKTARSYLKKIFLKTDTSRQGDLVVLMLASSMRLRPGIMAETL